MNRIAALLVLTATLTTGCVAQNRRASYVLNGAATVLGGVIIASASGSSNDSSTNDVSGGIGAAGAGAGAIVLGLPLLVIGGVGLLRTASEGSWAPAPAPMPYQAAPSTGVITAPGMTPARVTLR